MGTLRNRFFLEGIVLGSLCGVALGSLIAFQINSERIHTARRMFDRVVLRREPTIDFSLLRQ